MNNTQANSNRNPIARFFRYLADLVVGYFRRNSGILIALLILCLFLWFSTATYDGVGFFEALGTSKFMNGTNLLTVLRQICQNALLAFGMTCVLIVGGIDPVSYTHLDVYKRQRSRFEKVRTLPSSPPALWSGWRLRRPRRWKAKA